MPASRSARAMILAPRSCPSRPGLATTTRILRAVAASIRPGTLAGTRAGAAAPGKPGGRGQPVASGNPFGAEAGEGRQQGHRECDQPAAEALEAQRLPVLLAG